MAPTPGITSNSTRRTLDPIDPQERKAVQTQAKDAVSTLADDIASQPVNKPTDQTSADTRRAIRFDPTTNQLITRINGQVPTATNNDGTVTITGTAEADRIRVEQEEDRIRAYYTDENDEERLIDEWSTEDVERVEVDGGEGDDTLIGDNLDDRFTLGGGAGNDRLVNKGEETESGSTSAALEGGEGDDQLVNTQTGATLRGGAGANEIVNSGNESVIGDEGSEVESEDYVFNASNDSIILYENEGAHEIQSIGDFNAIETAGDDGAINAVGDTNNITLNGTGNDVTMQGDGNAIFGKTGGNTVNVAGMGNGVDMVGTGNTVELNGDGNIVATDNAAGILLDNFDELDADGDGFLLPEEIAQVPGAEDIAAHADALMFGTIQEGSNAWHGLSREDLQTVADRMYGGETLEDISQDLMTNSWLGKQIAEDGEVTPEAFSEAVNRYRQSNPRPDVDPMELTPLLDINQIGVWGDMNQVAAPGPSTALAFDGSGNTLNVGSNSMVAGQGLLNQINLGGQNNLVGFMGDGNEINSGGGNAIFGMGDFNTINSQGWDLIGVDGWNEINQQFDPGALQAALAPYFADMGPSTGLDSETMIALLLQQNRGRVA